MIKPMFSVLVVSLVLGSGTFTVRAQNKEAFDAFEQRVRTINETALKPGNMKPTLAHISTETGVPLERVEALHKHHPKAGAAGIMLSCVLADETKATPEKFLEVRLSGKGWAGIARDHKVPLDKLSGRLDRLEKAMSPNADSKEKPKAGKS